MTSRHWIYLTPLPILGSGAGRIRNLSMNVGIVIDVKVIVARVSVETVSAVTVSAVTVSGARESGRTDRTDGWYIGEIAVKPCYI